MTPDQLQQLIDRMTPGPWYIDANGFILSSDQSYDDPCFYLKAKLNTKNSPDQQAAVALRNHASALVECAKLLTKARDQIDTRYDQSIIYEIDAALKRLEEIK